MPDRRHGRTRPGCHRDHLGLHAHSVAAHRVHRQAHHDLERPHLFGDLRRVRRGHACPDRRACCRADQRSAWASSRGLDVACPQPLDGRRALRAGGRLADVVRQVGRRLHRHAARGADPFLARRRRDYCRAAGYQDAEQLGRRAVLQWTPAGAGVWDRAAHQCGRRAQLGRAPAARLDAEPPSAAVELPAHLVPLARLVASLPALRRRPPPEPERVLPARHRPSLQLPLSLLSSSAPAAARSPASP